MTNLQSNSVHAGKRTVEEQSEQIDLMTTRIVGGNIVGGDITTPQIYPWFARFENIVTCGGVLISPEYVMTAAHW